MDVATTDKGNSLTISVIWRYGHLSKMSVSYRETDMISNSLCIKLLSIS